MQQNVYKMPRKLLKLKISINSKLAKCNIRQSFPGATKFFQTLHHRYLCSIVSKKGLIARVDFDLLTLTKRITRIVFFSWSKSTLTINPKNLCSIKFFRITFKINLSKNLNIFGIKFCYFSKLCTKTFLFF